MTDYSELDTLEEVHNVIMSEMEDYQNNAAKAIEKGNKSAARRARSALQNITKLKKPFKEMSMDIGK